AGGRRGLPGRRRGQLYHRNDTGGRRRGVSGPVLTQGQRPGKGSTVGLSVQSRRTGAKTSTTDTPSAPALAEWRTWLAIVYVSPTRNSRDWPSTTMVTEPR